MLEGEVVLAVPAFAVADARRTVLTVESMAAEKPLPPVALSQPQDDRNAGTLPLDH